MQYCVDHPEEINKLSKVKAQVTEVKGVMMENIEKVRIIQTCQYHNSGSLLLAIFFFIFGLNILCTNVKCLSFMQFIFFAGP